MNGFMIYRDGKPLSIDLTDDLIAGMATVGDSFPVFRDLDDAKEVLYQCVGLYVNFSGGAIVPVSLTFGEPVVVQENSDEVESGHYYNPDCDCGDCALKVD